MPYIGGKLAPWFDDDPNHRAMANIADIGASYAAEIAEDNTPVETGKLRKSWEITAAQPVIDFLGYAWEATWKNDADYAAYVNYGTGLWGPEHRKYLIRAKGGGSLHWVDKLTGEDRFAKWVMHPGSPGNHMLEISAGMLEATWVRLARPALTQWSREVERQNPWATVT